MDILSNLRRLLGRKVCPSSAAESWLGRVAYELGRSHAPERIAAWRRFPGVDSYQHRMLGLRGKTVAQSQSGSPMISNPALDPAPFGRWTLRDEAAQRRSAPR